MKIKIHTIRRYIEAFSISIIREKNGYIRLIIGINFILFFCGNNTKD